MAIALLVLRIPLGTLLTSRGGVGVGSVTITFNRLKFNHYLKQKKSAKIRGILADFNNQVDLLY